LFDGWFMEKKRDVIFMLFLCLPNTLSKYLHNIYWLDLILVHPNSFIFLIGKCPNMSASFTGEYSDDIFV